MNSSQVLFTLPAFYLNTKNIMQSRDSNINPNPSRNRFSPGQKSVVAFIGWPAPISANSGILSFEVGESDLLSPNVGLSVEQVFFIISSFALEATNISHF